MNLIRRVLPLGMIAALLCGLGLVAVAHPGHEVGGDAAEPASQLAGQLSQPLGGGESSLANVHGAGSLPRSVVLATGLTVFVLAIFVGFEVIAKVPPTLHTPLMSGSNAISGITVVGAILAAGRPTFDFVTAISLLAIVLAMINVVGGFVVTDRILRMFKRR